MTTCVYVALLAPLVAEQSVRFLCLIILSAVSNAALSYLVTTVPTRLITTALNKDGPAAVVCIAWAVPAMISIAAVSAGSMYLGECLALDWRRALTRKVRLYTCTLSSSSRSSPFDASMTTCYHLAGAQPLLPLQRGILAQSRGSSHRQL